MHSDTVILMGVSVILGLFILGCDYLQYRWTLWKEMRSVKRELRRTRQQ